jgi:hypothetical protein
LVFVRVGDVLVVVWFAKVLLMGYRIRFILALLQFLSKVGLVTLPRGLAGFP